MEGKNGQLTNATKLLKSCSNSFKTREEAMDYANSSGLTQFMVIRTFEPLAK